MNAVKKTARITGVFYLAIFFANLFVFMFVSGSLNVAGDAAATAANIRASGSLYRSGVVSYLIVFLSEIGTTILLYKLLTPVNDYTQEDFTQSGQQYDLIFDTVGNHSVSDYKQALKSQGRFVTAAFLPVLVFQGLWPAKPDGQKMVNMMAKPDPEDLTYVAKLLEAGKVKPVIDRCYSLQEVPKALHYLKEWHARGKVIITLGIESKT